MSIEPVEDESNLPHFPFPIGSDPAICGVCGRKMDDNLHSEETIENFINEYLPEVPPRAARA